jgi:Mce-associated membrane protein
MSAPERQQSPAGEEIHPTAASSPSPEESDSAPGHLECGEVASGGAGGGDAGGGDAGGGDAGGGDAERGPTGTVPVPVTAPDSTGGDRRQARVLVAVAVLGVVLVALSVVFGMAWKSARESGPTANQAFVDSGETSALVGQATNAIITLYSYDYRKLPENEAAARSVITGRFAREFDRVFAPVKQRAPQEQAEVRTSVPAVAVTMLTGDRARLLMMVNQTGTRGPDLQATGATARLVVDAERVAGRWKIAEVTPE